MLEWIRLRPFVFRLHRLHDEPILLALWRCLPRKQTPLGTRKYWSRKGYG